MSDVPRSERSSDAERALDEGILSTVDAGGVTPDAFLAEVARIPERTDVPIPDGMPKPGDTLGRFRVISELGRGGMGVVYAAEDRTLGREVALKVLPTSDDERRRRFLREARSAAGLSHASIATIYDVGEIDGRVFIAMELVRGRTLRAALDARSPAGAPAGAARRAPALPLAEALRVAREIGRALAQAHARGVVHRDLKPENVMIAEDGQVKLLDFGLAKQSDGAQPAGLGPAGAPASAPSALTTEAGRILGTPSYMSPEQAKGQPVDARSDVFSFGVMLYELCAGARPFVGATVVELFIALDRDEPAPPSRSSPEISDALERVILRCLRKAPAARYPDAGAVLRDLERAAERPRAVGPRWGRPLTAITALVAIVALAVIARLEGPRVRALFGPTAFAVDAFPMPSSTSAPALAAYREGLEDLRRGGDYVSHFEKALDLDPTLGGAHVQLAATGLGGMGDVARSHLRKAEAARASLSERDRALLEAVEPVAQRQPSDWAESKRRLLAMVERTPGDAQAWYLLGLADGNFDDFEASVRHLDRALAVDPAYASAESFKALILMYLGRFDEARAVLDRCIARTPSSHECLAHLAYLQNEAGACEAAEATARQMIARSSEPQRGYLFLAGALAARGRPVATVREALRQSAMQEEKIPTEVGREREKKWATLGAARFAALQGDFEAAERETRAYAEMVTSSTLQQEHGLAASMLAGILEEEGRLPEAAQAALEFLDRRDAWEPDPRCEDIALATDATPALLRVALRAGRLTPAELASRRDPWLSAWRARVTPVARNYLWMYAYARVVDSPDDARAALAALPEYGPLPPFRADTLVDVDVAHTYLLAGRPGEAGAWLEHATRSCQVLSFPVDYVHAHLLLGQAREAQSDTVGACAAYKSVLERWGQAKPRSVTAERASERAAALACGR